MTNDNKMHVYRHQIEREIRTITIPTQGHEYAIQRYDIGWMNERASAAGGKKYNSFCIRLFHLLSFAVFK